MGVERDVYLAAAVALGAWNIVKRGRTMWKGHLAKFKITFVKRVNSREGWVQIRTDNSRRYPAINLNLVLSKESTATKDVGTTVDKTTIPV